MCFLKSFMYDFYLSCIYNSKHKKIRDVTRLSNVISLEYAYPVVHQTLFIEKWRFMNYIARIQVYNIIFLYQTRNKTIKLKNRSKTEGNIKVKLTLTRKRWKFGKNFLCCLNLICQNQKQCFGFSYKGVEMKKRKKWIERERG